MKKHLYLLLLPMLVWAISCQNMQKKTDENMSNISQATIGKVVSQLVEKHGPELKGLAEKGVSQTASLWTAKDGSIEEFEAFCMESFSATPEARQRLFEKLSDYYETLYGNFNAISLGLNKVLHLDLGPIESVDIMFGSFAPSAHLVNDLFENKIAFLTILNFPFYTLEEKTNLGANWSRLEWAYARMGDFYTSRVPAELIQNASKISTESSNYIDEYNILMGKLRDNQGQQLFADGMKLITHWGLRDEIKSNYSNQNGLPKQRMVYEVMKRIISQEIPKDVINSDEYEWNPFTNQVWKGGNEVTLEREPDTRYLQLKNNFLAGKAIDAYQPRYPNNILRSFDQGLELSIDEVEALFVEMLSSEQFKQTGALISQRLGRPLEPFDIWYDGFKARSTISEQELNSRGNTKYPNRDAFQKDLAPILVKLGYKPQRAEYLASKITVDASRGAGHAWGAAMRSQNSRLRTRIGANGMDYKGYNIAIHEFGHNVEQTISLYNVDYYTLNGVPNTAFTEALAFIFQVRDLELLGIKNPDPLAKSWMVLDNFWGTCEIMGVSVVDMKVWRWMYENPDATPEELKQQVILVATEVWNDYFAPVFGLRDEPILAIYSHMISYPLYLSAYPLGHLIEFQLEQHLVGKNFADEVDRIFSTGRVVPQMWMKNAVGMELSNKPMLNAVAESLEKVKQ